MNSAKRSFRKISLVTLTTLLLLSSSLQSSEGLLPEDLPSFAPIAQVTLSKDQQENIEKLKLAIDEVERRIPLRQQEAILLVGDTGEGKSYLLNYIAEVPLVGKKVKGKFGELVVHTDNPLEGTVVSHGTISSTSLPVGWNEFWDCPGFIDTRGSVQNIVNAFSIYKLAKSSDKIKVVIVVSENTLKGSRQAKFLNLIHNVGETFRNNEAITQSLVLVVTKNRELDLTLTREGLSSICEEQESQETFTSQKKIVECLSSDESRIAFFQAPKKEGEISGEDRSLILETIEMASYLNNPQASIAISAEAKLLIKDLADELSDDITTFITDPFYQEVLKYCHTLIDRHSDTAQELREKLNGFAISLKDLTFNREEFDRDLQKILKIIKSLGHKSLEETLSKKMQRLDFIRLVKPATLEIKTQADSWSPQIKKLTRDLVEVAASPETGKNRDHLTLKGFIIGSSDIQAALKNESQITEVEVYSLNSFFVDEDLQTHGLNLTLVAPQWYINGKKLISLKGKTGPSHQVEKATDGRRGSGAEIHGKNGLPGLPGFNGGHLYVKGNEFTNVASLIFDVSGGEGGKGQRGGNGAQGLAGGNGGLADIETRSSPYLVSRKKLEAQTAGDYLEKGAKFFLTFNDKFEEVYRSFEPGNQGGNAGRGGKGGSGGKTGSSRIELGLRQNLNLINNNGNPGPDGEIGEPGAGGRNGPTYKGVYINEMVAPAIRGYKEVSANGTIGSIAGGGTGAVAGAGIAAATAETFIVASSREVIKKGAKVVITNGGKEIAKGVVTNVAKEGAKTAVTLGTSTVASAAAGMGVGFLVQALTSPISAALSSYWKEEPSSIDSGIGYAASGEAPRALNAENMREPHRISPSIKYDEKLKTYQNFYQNKKDNQFSKNF